MNTAFDTLPLSEAMLRNLVSLEYATMTPVQALSLPDVLAGHDVIVQAQTGSGKTAAFGIGVAEKLTLHDKRVQALILCPTRELAEQVAGELRRLVRRHPNVKILTLCGGVPLAPQRDSLRHGAHVIVGTPGRIRDHLGRQTFTLESIHTFVLDEADRMLEMGFAEEIMKIAAGLPAARQTLLFSATYPEQIARMSRDLMDDARMIRVEAVTNPGAVKHHFFAVTEPKVQTLRRVLGHFLPESALVFCNTKAGCDTLADTLEQYGFDAVALHGDLRQGERTEVLTRFESGGIRLLIATDVAARGLDVKDLSAVIHYDLPEKPETFIHRNGRTARAGSHGTALTLFTPAQQDKVQRLAEAAKLRFTAEDASAYPSAAPETLLARYAVLRINGGKKSKLRPGDLLGTLCAHTGIDAGEVGNIAVFDTLSYVAVEQHIAETALKQLQENKIKGRKFRVERR